MTQPAFTRAIQKLEEELGGALLYRERNLTQFTELAALCVRIWKRCWRRRRRRGGRRRTSAGWRLPRSASASVRRSRRRVSRRGAQAGAILPESPSISRTGTAALMEAMLCDALDCALLPDDPDLPERLHRLAAARPKAARWCCRRGILWRHATP